MYMSVVGIQCSEVIANNNLKQNEHYFKCPVLFTIINIWFSPGQSRIFRFGIDYDRL